MSSPQVTFHTLPHADGSATYSRSNYTIIGAVNGPIEPQRRDELPEEAFIEVNLRLSSGSGGPRERHLEALIHSTLRSIILTHAHPRSLIQLTLQILSTPASASSSAPVPQHASIIPSLPHLLHTALLSLLSANIPLNMTFTAALVAVLKDGTVVVEPMEKVVEGEEVESLHVFGYGSTGDLLVVESEGVFDDDVWEEAAIAAESACRGAGSEEIDNEGATGLDGWLRGVVAMDLREGAKWRGNLLE